MALDILHKKSSVSQRLPVPLDLGLGEIAINYNADGPFLTCKDTAGNIRKLNNVWVATTSPTGSSPGDLWLDTSVTPAKLYVYKDAASQFVAVVNIDAATASALGTVILASSTDVINGTPARVVDAAQLKSETSGLVRSVVATTPLSIAGTVQSPSVSISPGLARQVLQTNSTADGVEFTSNIDIPGTLTVQGNLTANSNVGIGTNNPQAKLDVAGIILSQTIAYGNDQDQPYLIAGATNYTGANTNWGTYGFQHRIKSNSGGTARVTIDTFQGEAFCVTNARNVGIGTDNPQAKLHVEGDNTTKIWLASTSSGRNSFDPDEASIDLTAYGMNTTSKYTPSINFGSTDSSFTTTNPKFGAAINAEAAQSYTSDTQGGMKLNFWTSPSSPGTGHGLEKRMTISNTGNVGVGTDSPQAKLDVDGQATVKDGLTIKRGSIAPSLVFENFSYAGGDSSIGSFNSGSMVFSTNATEKVRITSDGNVGVGTTSPDGKLTIQGDVGDDPGDNPYVQLQNSNTPMWALRSTTGNSGLSLDGNWSNTWDSKLTILRNNGNVGIGTDNPQAKLDVTGTAGTLAVTSTVSTNSSRIIISGGSSSYAGINLGDSVSTNQGYIRYYNSDDSLRFAVNASEEMRIDSNGNVGVGTDSPEAKLDVRGADQTSTALDPTNLTVQLATNEGQVNSGGTLGFGANANNRAAFAAINSLYKNGSNEGIGDLAFNLRAVDTDTTLAEVMRLKFNGNVGVGTDDPTTKLEVVGDITIKNGAQVNAIRTNADGQLQFMRNSADNNAPSVTIDDETGNVGVGTDSPSEKLSVSGNGTFTGTVSAQGSVLTSDQRFKENITDANAQLADVTALGNSLRNWDWTADAPVADKDTRFLGLVAQEAETICPGIVTTIARTKDGDELTPEVVVPAVYETRTVPAVLDEEGEVVEAETTEEVLVTEEQVTPATYEQLDDSYKGIKNDILIMKLLGAVAELSAKVAALEAS